MTAVRVHINTFEYKDARFGWYELFADQTDLGSSDVETYAAHSAIFFADYYLHANLNGGETWHYWVRAVFDNGDTVGNLTYLGSLTLVSGDTDSDGTGGAPAPSATITASEDLAGGDLVNIWTSSGAVRVRKANATDATKPADGFVIAAVTSGNPATVYFTGQIDTSRAGLTPGTQYWLDTAGGAIATVMPATAGNLRQKIGKALSATSLLFMPFEGDQV